MEDAVRANDQILVALLKSHGAILSSTFQSATLYQAASTGNVHELELLYKSGANMDIKNYDKVRNACTTPAPVQRGSMSCMREMVERQASWAVYRLGSMIGTLQVH